HAPPHWIAMSLQAGALQKPPLQAADAIAAARAVTAVRAGATASAAILVGLITVLHRVAAGFVDTDTAVTKIRRAVVVHRTGTVVRAGRASAAAAVDVSLVLVASGVGAGRESAAPFHANVS